MIASLFAETLDAVLIADDDRRYVDANPAACELFGLDEDALIGRRIDDFAIVSSAEMAAMWHQFLTAGKLEGTFPIRRCDGSERMVHFRARAGVGPGRHLSILRDVTELVRAAERAGRLQALTERLSDTATPRAILEVAMAECLRPLGVARGWMGLCDGEPQQFTAVESVGHGADACPVSALLLDCNTAIARAALGHEPLFVASPAEQRIRLPACAPTFAAAGVGAIAAVPLLSRRSCRGALLLAFAQPRPFDDDNRGFLLTVGRLCAQALERAQLLAQTERARTAAEAASRHKDEFLAMLGHELRNPLAPMVTALQLMKLRDGGAFPRERAIIERQVRHMMRLVDDLLDVSRITRGQIDLRRQRIEVGPLLAEAIETASPLLEDKAHHVEIDVATDLWVDGDAGRLVQVFANLLTNAAKYTDPGGYVTVTAGLVRDEVVVAVRDTGIGITADMQPHVFELFVQGARSQDRAEGGLGIGLSLVRSLTALHGGTVTLASAAGRGSQFTVRLPAAAAPSCEVHPRDAADGCITMAGRRVLVVDDNSDAAELLAMALIGAGHEVRVAHDGPTALETTRGFDFDVALLDLGLPVMDGIELGERLRALGHRGRLVAVTGYGQEADRQRSRAAGFAAHLVKPVDLEQILRTVEMSA
jgi:PAS domain S-box-containing protein